MELAAETQAAIEAMKNKCKPTCSPQDRDSCRCCWNLEIELERLMRLYHGVKDATGR
ncbi:hypothetical protein [Solidesulfovibrio magneticus]|uniref:hypothetical protein n=1 Tax=Solidesulfovibrio magneticus TaxID=184917 RepID=UPI001E45D0F2|nr:hypothetical protein [Solidesulfovibrio magneticus]